MNGVQIPVKCEMVSPPAVLMENGRKLGKLSILQNSGEPVEPVLGDVCGSLADLFNMGGGMFGEARERDIVGLLCCKHDGKILLREKTRVDAGLYKVCLSQWMGGGRRVDGGWMVLVC